MQEPGEGRIRRAIVAFGLTLAFGLVVLGIVLTSPGGEPVVRLVGASGPLLLLMVLGVELLGLLLRRPWAVAMATPILLLLVVVGALLFVDALAHQSLNIPIVPLICIWALWPRAAEVSSSVRPATLGRSDSIRAVAIGLGCTVALAWPVISAGLLRAGGPLISAPTDLDASIQMDCQDGVEPGDTVDVTYRWSWVRTEPIAGGEDRLTISWSGTTDDEPAVPALLTDEPAPGLSRSDMQLGANEIAVIYGIDLAAQQFQAGTVRLRLGRQTAQAGSHGFLAVKARYVRGAGAGPNGLWVSPAATAACSW